MIIDIVQGDIITLFKTGKRNLIHGCNCFHTMGAGVAGYIAKEFPQSLEMDKNTEYGDYDKLGTFSTWTHRVGNCIMLGINLYTQYHPGPDARYPVIRDGFARLNETFAGFRRPFLVPKIGCGIGGLTWEKVSAIINDVTPDMDLICVEYSK